MDRAAELHPDLETVRETVEANFVEAERQYYKQKDQVEQASRKKAKKAHKQTWNDLNNELVEIMDDDEKPSRTATFASLEKKILSAGDLSGKSNLRT